MKTLVTGSPEYDPIFHVLNNIKFLIDSERGSTEKKSQISKVYYLDYSLSSRIRVSKMTEQLNKTINIVSDCNQSIIESYITSIESDLIDNPDWTVILYINLDSIKYSMKKDVCKILNDIDKLCIIDNSIDLICLSTARVLDSDILDHFDKLYMFKDTSPPSLKGISDYIQKNNTSDAAKCIASSIAGLNKKSSDNIYLSDIVKNASQQNIKDMGAIIAQV
jgi:hypothetical protein